MPLSNKIELAKSLFDNQYQSDDPRIGIEFEFKIDKNSVSRVNEFFIKIGSKYHGMVTNEFYASFDFSQLIEFRSYPMAIGEFNYDVFSNLRKAASQWLRDRNINFIWYGWHFSIWGVPKHNMGKVAIQRALSGEKVLLHSEVFSEKDYASGWFGNTWRDPFTRNYHLHKFVEAHVLISQKEHLLYDRSSMRLGWSWFNKHYNLLREASNRFPVPGCAIRVGSKRRIELVAGWMDTDFEKHIIESMITMDQLPVPSSIPKQPLRTIRFPGSRRRVATMLLPGLSYDQPPKLPNTDWDSVCFDKSWRPKIGEPWPIIGDIPAYWPNDQTSLELFI